MANLLYLILEPLRRKAISKAAKQVTLIILQIGVLLLIPSFLRSQIPVTPGTIQFNTIPNNKAIDEQMLRYFAKYANLLIMRGVENSLQPPKWNDPKGYLDSVLFAKVKQFNPNVTTAFYTKLEAYSTTNDTLFDIETIHGMDSLGVPVLIPDPQNNTVPMVTNGDFIYGDSRNKIFRNWIIGRTDTTFHQKVKTDGWLFDRAWIDPVSRFFPSPYNTDASLIQSYMDSNYTFMQQVRLAFPNAYILVNGISPETYAKQTKFLDFADGQMVEAFGITEANDSIFSSAVLPYIRMMDSTAFINKHFYMFGSGHGSYSNSDTYRFYSEEKRWERYLFSCFLLGTNGVSGFHFRTGSEYPLRGAVSRGRFGTLDLHTDYIYNRLGKAVNHYTAKSNGLYARNFEDGFIVVAPVTNTVQTYTYKLTGKYYDNEGNTYSSGISLKSGEAFILYYNKQPDLPCKYEINFDDGDNGNGIGLKDLPNATIKGSSNKFLRFIPIKPSSGYDEFEHDIMLDWVRYQNKDSLVTFKYRTKYPKATIQIFCEVDDTLTYKYYNAILNFSVSTPEIKNFDNNYAYRTFFSPVNQPQQVPNVQSSTTLINDGHWHTITISGNELLKAGVKFIRPHYMRVKGKIDLDDIIVYHGGCSSSLSSTKTQDPNSASGRLIVKAFPNPTKTEFSLFIESSSSEPVKVRVLDMYGKSIYQTKGSVNQTYRFGQMFLSGVYLVEITQGKNIKTIKIVKS